MTITASMRRCSALRAFLHVCVLISYSAFESNALAGRPSHPVTSEKPHYLVITDTNDDGTIDVADAITVLSHLFAGSGPLPAPFGECGIDPTADELDCAEYPGCE